MSGAITERGHQSAEPPRMRLAVRLIHQLPYIALIVLGLVGVSWSDLSTRSSVAYWVLLTPISAALCIAAGWPQRHRISGWIGLVITQVLQWAGILLAMYLITVSDVHGVLDDDATGLILLTLLALGVAISGLYLRAWKLGVVGVFLASAVPITAWIEQAALILLVIGVALVVLLTLELWLGSRAARNSPALT